MNFKGIFILLCIVFLPHSSFSLTDDDRDKYIGISRIIHEKMKEEKEADIDTSSLPKTSEDIELRGILEDVFSDLASYYSYRFYDLKEQTALPLIRKYVRLKEQNQS